MFYIRKLGKTSKIACFRDLNPLNVVFRANFVPYPMRLNARDFLSHIWNIEIFVIRSFWVKMVQNWVIYDQNGATGQNLGKAVKYCFL